MIRENKQANHWSILKSEKLTLRQLKAFNGVRTDNWYVRSII